MNRWPHGYSYEYMSLDDPEWAEGQVPHEIGRARFGRISIANSDAEGRAYLDAAIDVGWRAVEEQTVVDGGADQSVECVAGLEIKIILFGVAHEEAVSFEQPCVIKWVDAVTGTGFWKTRLILTRPTL